jgi:hypothetical protein
MEPTSNEFLSNYFSTLFGEAILPLKILCRKKFDGSGTFPAEVVTCETRDHSTMVLFCKYLVALPQNVSDHRSGVAYEANFYNTVLSKIPVTKVSYYGHTELPQTGGLMMVLGYLGDDLRIDHSSDPGILLKAAAWIAKFHSLDLSASHSQMRKYDSQYFIYWLKRFEHLSAGLCQQHPCITDILEYFENNIHLLLSTEPCIIHGEYYPKNILVKEGSIYPVDWECAAVGPGEIDLACLIEGWDNAIAEKAKEVYFSKRASEGRDKPASEKKLLMAQLYLFFRWWPERLQNMSVKAQSQLIKYLNVLMEKIYSEGALQLQHRS